jgi:hypothetical protein
MNNDINVADLVASITEEASVKKGLEKTAGMASLKSRLTGSQISKTAEDAQIVADTIAAEVGIETLTLSQQLEKTASEMEKASSTDEIIKIASDLNNSDLAHISTIASKLADVVYADLQNKVTDGGDI